MKKTTLFLILCMICAFLPPVAAEGSVTGSLTAVNEDMTEITGKLNPGTTFYVGGSFQNNSSKDVSYSVYCGVYSGGMLCAVYKGDVNTLKPSETAIGACAAKIPEDIPYLNYYIRGFALTEEKFSPLCPAYKYNASEAYETARYEQDGVILYTGKEMLNNGDMEYDNSFADGWDSRNSSRLYKDTECVLSGSASCRVSNRDICYDGITQDITAQMKETGKYRIKGSVYSTLENVNFQCIIRFTYAGSKDTKGYTVGWLPVKEAGKWYSFDNVKDIEVPPDVVKAELYFESLAGWDDFYVDGCSLKPLITYTQYLEENADPMDEYPEEYQIIADEYAKGVQVIYPRESNERLINPYKGLVCYQFKTSYANILTKPAGDCAGVLYTRFSWAALEPERGKYNFDLIKENLELLKDSGKMLGIGIAPTINYNSPSSWNQETPDWVFDECGAKYLVEFKGTDHEFRVPVYNDPVFIEEYSKLIDAFAKEFNGYTNIAYVDMRSYGNWGEWHFGGLSESNKKSAEYTNNDLNKMVDVFQNIRLPLMMFTSQPAQQSYAMKKYGAGIRVDGTMNPELANNHRRLAVADGVNAAIAEWFDQPNRFYVAGTYNGTKYPNGKWSDYYEYMPVMMEKTVKEGKTSYMAMGYWNPEEFYNCFTDLCERLANKTGYWFKPARIAYTNGNSGTFSMTVKNDGYSSLYAGYKRNACVKLALADADGTILESTVLDGIDPGNWKPGKYSFETASYAFSGLNSGKLMLGVFSDADAENPDIKLGIECPSENGWYDLAQCVQIEYPSDNKLYSEKSAYADEGYGYRSPMYAFDGDSNTFWACEGVAGSYLDIDFGGQNNVSEMKFNAEIAGNTKISVTVCSDGKWITLKNGVPVQNGENTVSFDSMRISRLRISLDENVNGALKIYEMTVK